MEPKTENKQMWVKKTLIFFGPHQSLLSFKYNPIIQEVGTN